MNRLTYGNILIGFLVAASFAAAADRGVPVEKLPASMKLDPFYAKHLDAGGIAVVSSKRVSDFALREAAFLVDRMLESRPDLRAALVRGKLRVVVMAASEFTTDVPEHRHLTPKQFWDKRARGLGATRESPVVSCGEENLLNYPGDPYQTESILIHEFGHTIHDLGLRVVDPGFQSRLEECYTQAKKQGLWKGTYAITNVGDYWAEAVQSWFDTNRPPDRDHNHVNTREELKAYDPALASLVSSVFGDTPWRYQPTDQRKDSRHLEGFVRATCPRFVWPPLRRPKTRTCPPPSRA